MEKITITYLHNYKNHGQDAEQSLTYALVGEIRNHDHVPFNIGSDIPEFAMSVKSEKASLFTGGAVEGETFEELFENFFNTVASEKFAYVANNSVAYVMTKELFKQFVKQFAGLDRDSQKNGGKVKIRLRTESQKMMEWLDNN